MSATTPHERLLSALTAAAIHACAAHEAAVTGAWVLCAAEIAGAAYKLGEAHHEAAVCQDTGDPAAFLAAAERQAEKRGSGSG